MITALVTEKNTNIARVQFVIKTEGIKTEEVEDTEEKETEERNVWQKFLALFKRK